MKLGIVRDEEHRDVLAPVEVLGNRMPCRLVESACDLVEQEDVTSEQYRRNDTDALLFVSCNDQIATTGRKALQAGSIILGALVGVQATPLYGITNVSIALVETNTGSILWYNYHGSRGDHDLRDPINTTTLIKGLLRDFPM